jgi:hypothetical protein
MFRVEIHALEQATMAVSVEALRQRVVAGTESRLHGDLIWESATVFNPQVVRKGRQFSDRLLVVATETQDRECGGVIIGSH